MYIDDSSTLTVMEMRAKCRRLKAEHGLSLIIVDYLQLMSGYGKWRIGIRKFREFRAA